VGFADGIHVADPGGRYGAYLGSGGYFLFSTGEIITGTMMTLYFIVVVGLADNILRPLLVGKDTRMPDYLILLTTLGGLQFFGINGFVLGPMIAGLFIASWNLLAEDRALAMKSEQ
jgi:predicted PurR-regulated permease PerM